MERVRAYLTLTIFAAVLVFPLVNSGEWLLSDIRNFENRRLAERADIQCSPVDSFPSSFERFYKDQFPARARMIKTFNKINLFTWKKSPNGDFAIVGNDGWLFLAGEEFDCWSGKKKMTAAELEKFRKTLEERKKFIERTGAKFYVMIVPVKAAIYPEKVPWEKVRTVQRSLGEEILNYMQSHSDVAMIDLYDELRKRRNVCMTYYATDNHWTRLGAFYSTRRLLETVKKDYPVVRVPEISDYHVYEKDTIGGNTSEAMGVVDLYHRTRYELKKRSGSKAREGDKAGYKWPEKFPYPWLFEEVLEVDSSDAPKAVIISDSFGNYLFPLAAEHFRKTVKIWDNWEYKLNEEILSRERPDVVVLLIHEKNVDAILR